MPYKPKRTRNKSRISMRPFKSVLNLSGGDRAVGTMYSLDLHGAERTVFHDLAGDIFFSLYKFSPELVDKKQLPPERLVTRAMMEHLFNQEYFLNARMYTMLSTPEAYSATRAVWDALLNDKIVMQALEMAQQAADNIERKMQALDKPAWQKKQKGNADQQQKEGEESQSKGDNQQDSDGQGESSQSKQKSNAERELEQAIKDAQELAKRIENSGLLQRSMGEAAKQGADEAGETSSRMSSWGFDKGQMANLSPETAEALSNQYRSQLNQIADKIGRVAGVASRALEQIKAGYIGPPTKVANTRDFSRIFQTERLAFHDRTPPVIRATKVSQYVLEGLLGWKPASEGKKRGPFVAYVDESGSMRGDKVVAAKAIAYGLAQVLMTDNQRQQSFRIRSFGAANQITNFISNESTPDQIVKWSSKFLNAGNTDFNTPLTTALRDIEELRQKGVYGADVLMITDGQEGIDRDVRERFDKMRSEHGVRLFYIVVHDGSHSGEELDLRRMCDFIIDVPAGDFMSNPEGLAVDIVENMYGKEQKL